MLKRLEFRCCLCSGRPQNPQSSPRAIAAQGWVQIRQSAQFRSPGTNRSKSLHRNFCPRTAPANLAPERDHRHARVCRSRPCQRPSRFQPVAVPNQPDSQRPCRDRMTFLFAFWFTGFGRATHAGPRTLDSTRGSGRLTVAGLPSAPMETITKKPCVASVCTRVARSSLKTSTRTLMDV